MLSMGVFNGYYPYGLEESVRRIREDGFSCVQLDLSFKDMAIDVEKLDKKTCRRIRDAFRNGNVQIAAITGDLNFVHPDPGVRDGNIRKMKSLLKHARDLGCGYVVSEVGTFFPTHNWTHHPKNKTEEGYQELLPIIVDLVKFAYDHGATYLVEPCSNHVMHSVERVLRLFADVNHKSMGFVMDPANLYTPDNIDANPDQFLLDAMDALKNIILLAHAKDCRRAGTTQALKADIDAGDGHAFRGEGGIELPAAGLGIINYPLYLDKLFRINPNMPILIEHVDSREELLAAKRYVEEKMLQASC